MDRSLLILVVALWCGNMPARAQESSFINTGEMTTARSGHTATLLPDGRVLIAGGEAGSNTLLDSTELFDPTTGAFTATGRMTSVRHGHSATLLANGLVLVAGGYGPGRQIVASAELYDPSTETFTPTGNMVTGQLGHTATLLPNGKVLIAGGLQGPPWPMAVPAELYEPSTGSFSPAGEYVDANTLYPAAAGPVWPSATLLGNGSVLLVGNNPAALYDPTSDTFSLTGGMTAPAYRYGMYWHSSTLLPNGSVLIAGGSDDLTMLSEAELYDPASGTFAATGSMSAPRAIHTATLLPDGTVLIAGGETWIREGSAGRFGGSLASAERYDPGIGMFCPTSPMAAARAGHTETALQNGAVLITGGVDYSAYPLSRPFAFLSSAELYIPGPAIDCRVIQSIAVPNLIWHKTARMR